MAVVEKVKGILMRQFPAPDKVTLHALPGGIVGSVTSGRFRQMDLIDRQKRILGVLESGLSPKEQGQVQVIVGLTPEEEAGFMSGT